MPITLLAPPGVTQAVVGGVLVAVDRNGVISVSDQAAMVDLLNQGFILTAAVPPAATFSFPGLVTLTASAVLTMVGGSLTAVPVSNDSVLRVVCSIADIVIGLPPAIGSGLFFNVKKTDSTSFVVRLMPWNTDLIDGESSFLIGLMNQSVSLKDVALGQWFVT